MKLVMVLVLLSVGYYCFQRLPNVISKEIQYCPSLIKFRESQAFCILRYSGPSLHTSRPCNGLNFVKCIIKKLTSSIQATALRLLLIIAGDVEQNPGPIDCPDCGKTFKRKYDMTAHKTAKRDGEMFSCNQCTFTTAWKTNLSRHIKKSHAEWLEPPTKISKLDNVESEVASVLNGVIDSVVRRDIKRKSALKGELNVYKLKSNDGTRDPETFLNSCVDEIVGCVNEELSNRIAIKLLMNPHIEMFKPVRPEETVKVHFSHKPVEIFRGSNVADDLRSAFPPILRAIDEFTREGSGWAIQRIIGLDVHLARLSITRGSSYHALTKELVNKKAMVNVKNKDNKFFMWSILAKLHSVKKNPQRVSKYKRHDIELDFTGIDFPVKINDIGKIENKNGLAINLYGYDSEVGLHPLRMSKETENRWIHMMLYEGHYSLIKNLDRLLFDQRGGNREKYFCPRCLTAKYTNEDRKAHYEVCWREDPTKIAMPEEKELKFINFKKTLRQPLVIYADFECLTEKVDGPKGAYQQHVPCGYGLVAVTGCCGSSNIDEPTIYRGEGSVKKLFMELRQYAVEHQSILNSHEDYRGMDDFDENVHRSNTCHICKEEITSQVAEERKVRDHCHFCNKYRGPAHRRCNWQYRKNRDIVVIFHNLRRYDGHLLMQQIGGEAQLAGWDIDVVAKTMEDYISFSLVHKREVEEKKGDDELSDEPNVKDHAYKIRFIDSFQFMSRSLAELASNLEDDQYDALGQEYEGRKLDLLKRKGVYPYDYMDCWDRFDERMFPRKRDFYNQLNDEAIKDDDYRHGMEVWKVFDMRTLGQYHDLYLKTDALLLADVFEQFRKISIDSYGLDPCHYMTAPSLTWDACLKMTGVTLELLEDPDMYMFFEQGIRGGILQISHRHAVANNRYLPETFDSSKPSSHIIYLDVNNLYGYAMVQSMPTHDIQWVEDINRIPDITTIDDEAETGYVLEVDLEYPEELHDAQASYPLAPEHHTINEVSPYCQYLK